MDPVTIGMIAGSLAGTAGSLLDKKEEDPNRPKRRKLSALQELLQSNVDRRSRFLAIMAQSHLDVARMF